MPTRKLHLLGAFQVLWMLKPAAAVSLGFVVLGTYFSQSKELLLRLLEGTGGYEAFLALTLPLLVFMVNLHIFNAVRLWRRITKVHRANINRLPHQALLSPGGVPHQTGLIAFGIVAAPLLLVAFELREGFVVLVPDPFGLRSAVGASRYDVGLIVLLSAALGYYYWWAVRQIKWFERLEAHTANTLRQLRESDVREQRRQPRPDEPLSDEKMPDGRDFTLENMEKHTAKMVLENVALGLFVIFVGSGLNLASAMTGGDVSTFGVLAWFLGGVILLYSVFDIMPSKLRWRIGTAALAVAVVLHAFNFAGLEYRQIRDTETAREAEQKAAALAPDEVLEKAFVAWLESRPDYEQVRARGRKYPVFVVSAQGGGIATAFHAAGLLGLVEDRCPLFASHVFAISSVSGGSLGAAAFAATAERIGDKKEVEATGKCLREAEAGKQNRTAIREFLAHNYLSAPLVALLNFDLPLYAMGLPFNPFDRAVALETAIENVWDRSAKVDGGRNYFSEGVKSAWQPNARGPMIIYNATLIDRGEPVLISPIGWSYRSRSGIRGSSLHDLRSSDVRTSTAVVLSARFPYLAAPAVLRDAKIGEEPRASIVRIGDGAYFDNSGIVTGAELILGLSAIIEAWGCGIRWSCILSRLSMRLHVRQPHPQLARS